MYHMEEETNVPHADFHSEYNNMAYWYPRLSDLDVPTPATQAIELDTDEEGRPEWDSETIRNHVLDTFGGEAFVRGGYKSAQLAGRGSHIMEATTDDVDHVLIELISQHVMMHMPLGGCVWLREWLDLNFCHYCRDNLVPEARVFIREGEVVCHHPRLEGFENHQDHRKEAVKDIDRAYKSEIEPHAETIAETFDERWWSVDFVMDTSGEWWVTDMALDALYERDGDVRGMSRHPDDCNRDIEVLAGKQTEV